MSGRDRCEQRTLRHHGAVLAIDTEEALLDPGIVGNGGFQLLGQFLPDKGFLVGRGEDAYLREPTTTPQPRNEVKHRMRDHRHDKEHRNSIACKVGHGLQNLIKRDIAIGLPRT